MVDSDTLINVSGICQNVYKDILSILLSSTPLKWQFGVHVKSVEGERPTISGTVIYVDASIDACGPQSLDCCCRFSSRSYAVFCSCVLTEEILFNFP